MAALTKEFPGRFEVITRAKVELAANAKAFAGGACVLDTKAGSATKGYYLPATADTGKKPRGRFLETVDNTGAANGDKKVLVEFHKTITVIQWDNHGTNTLDKTDRGSDCYFEDDHTVGDSSTGKSAAGPVFDVTSEGVLVEVV